MLSTYVQPLPPTSPIVLATPLLSPAKRYANLAIPEPPEQSPRLAGASGTFQADTPANCHQDATQKSEGDLDRMLGQERDSRTQEGSPCS